MALATNEIDIRSTRKEIEIACRCWGILSVKLVIER